MKFQDTNAAKVYGLTRNQVEIRLIVCTSKVSILHERNGSKFATDALTFNSVEEAERFIYDTDNPKSVFEYEKELAQKDWRIANLEQEVDDLIYLLDLAIQNKLVSNYSESAIRRVAEYQSKHKLGIFKN